jgi:adenine-specific DNA-methyltransferase
MKNGKHWYSLMVYSFTQRSLDIGQRILARRALQSRKENGQFLTPMPLARFMAEQLGTVQDGDHILDPAMGSGTLLCALIERLIEENGPVEVCMDGFELDVELFMAAQSTLNDAAAYGAEQGIRVHLNLFHTDFVLNGLRFLRPLLLDTPVGHHQYQHIIANPPYFKINTTDARRQMMEGILSGHTNIYTLFMGLAARMLQDGRACFIVPRSFCSGTYFTRFRREFLEQVLPQRIHLFEARDDAFSQDDVLQENLVFTFAPRETKQASFSVAVSSSATVDELASGVIIREMTSEQFISPAGLFRLPTSEMDGMILDVVDSWTGSLHEYDLAISTGPVVPFRAEAYLLDEPDGAATVPLLWMQHIRPQQITWPLDNGFYKPQYIRSTPDAVPLLVRNANYVLLRRFSAKEEHRRLVAAPYLADRFSYSLLGLENHLNYIYRRSGEMSESEAVGLSALLNSGLIDRYFRISNGNTQVNATELRALPLPPLPVIAAIGQALMKETNHADLDAMVPQTLQTYRLVPPDFPILRETRVV